MSNNLKDAVKDAVSELNADIITKLSIEQQAALESKFNALPDEVRSSIASANPEMSVVGMYILRQMRKEANGKLASNSRPKWFASLELNAASLKSGEEAIRSYAENQLRVLADEIDSKESITLLRKYKNHHDLTSKDSSMIQLAGIFGVNAPNLA